MRFCGQFPRLWFLSHFMANLLCELASYFTSLDLCCLIFGLEQLPLPHFSPDVAAQLTGRKWVQKGLEA